MQIIILGMHRSGTSLTTRLVNMMGAYVGAEGTSIGFNEENPKGFWERKDVIEVNDAILSHFGCSWDNLHDWPIEGHEEHLPELPEEITKRIKNLILELDAHRPWVMKDPRLCHTFPFWRAHLEVPVIIFAHRDPLEVATSLQHRNGFTLPHAIALWEYAMVGALNSIQGLPVIHVDYTEMMKSPVPTTERLFSDLQKAGVQGLRMPTEREIGAFIDVSLYRSKAFDISLKDIATEAQLALANATHTQTTPASLRFSLQSKEVMALASEAKEMHRLYEEAQESLTHHEGLLEHLKASYARLEEDYTTLTNDSAASLDAVEHHLESYKGQLKEAGDQLDAIKATRVWRLRNWLLKKPA